MPATAGVRLLFLVTMFLTRVRDGSCLQAHNPGTTSWLSAHAGTDRGEPAKAFVGEISHLRTLSAKRLGKKLGRILVEEPDQVIEALNEIIGA